MNIDMKIGEFVAFLGEPYKASLINLDMNAVNPYGRVWKVLRALGGAVLLELVEELEEGQKPFRFFTNASRYEDSMIKVDQEFAAMMRESRKDIDLYLPIFPQDTFNLNP